LRLRVKESLGDDDKPTIAGRYIRLTWPCGTACAGTGLMDAKTGQVIVAHHMSGWGDVTNEFEPIEGRLNSRLIVLSAGAMRKALSVGTSMCWRTGGSNTCGAWRSSARFRRSWNSGNRVNPALESEVDIRHWRIRAGVFSAGMHNATTNFRRRLSAGRVHHQRLEV
jgi:hypothetical protein